MSTFLSINECLETGNEELNTKCQREERRLKKYIGWFIACLQYIFYFFKQDVTESEAFTLQAMFPLGNFMAKYDTLPNLMVEARGDK